SVLEWIGEGIGRRHGRARSDRSRRIARAFKKARAPPEREREIAMHYLMLLSELALRVLVLGALGAVAAWPIRRKGAEVQHAIWRIVLAGMLALPFLMAVLTPIQLWSSH